MNHLKLVNAILLASGIVGVIVGAGMLFVPVQFHTSSGVIIGGDVNLLNEMRAAGGALFICGMLIVAGAFMRSFVFTSAVLATALYTSYGLSRILSIVVDGAPAPPLLFVTGIEIIVGLACGAALIFLRRSHKVTDIAH